MAVLQQLRQLAPVTAALLGHNIVLRMLRCIISAMKAVQVDSRAAVFLALLLPLQRRLAVPQSSTTDAARVYHGGSGACHECTLHLGTLPCACWESEQEWTACCLLVVGRKFPFKNQLNSPAAGAGAVLVPRGSALSSRWQSQHTG